MGERIMSAAIDLIRRVQTEGGSIEANGDKLKLKAPQPLSSALIQELRANKPEVLAVLTPPSFHDCVDSLLRPGQVPTERNFEKATVIWLDKARKRRLSNA